jgi:putative colanic acid biosynthesis acetyltransferase WcaF
MSRTSRLELLRPIGAEDRFKRLIWRLAFLVLYRPTPVFAHAWRSMILRLFGATIDSGVYPYPNVRIWAPWNLTMRKGSCIAGEVDCYNVAPVVIGPGATISQKSYLCTASHDFDVRSFPLTGGQITIGAEAWIAADAFIGPGVSVGERAVVLARSVVVRDVDDGAVVGGNPSRFLRQRAMPEQKEPKERAS